MTDFGAGTALFIGGLLAIAGAIKLASPAAFRHAVYRLLPEAFHHRRTLSDVSAPVVGSVECIVGCGLVAALWLGHPWFVGLSVTAASVCAGFVAIVAYAMRKGASCGCFASFSDGPAGPVELGRAAVVAVIAAAGAIALVGSATPFTWRWPVAAWALIDALITVSWVAAGARVFGSRNATSLNNVVTIAQTAIGLVTTALGNTPLPIERRMSRDESDRYVARTLASPSFLAFANWLGPRTHDIDWSGVVAQSTKMRATTGEELTVTELEPTTPRGTRLSIIAGLDGIPDGDVLVFAVVDGVTIVASEGVVRAGNPLQASV